MYRKLFLRYSLFAAQLFLLSSFLGVPSRSQVVNVPAQEETGDYKLSGIVVNGVTGEPIRRALVQVFQGSIPAVLTDSDGKFEFDGLSEGRIQVNARKPGYFNEREISEGRGQFQQFDVGPDASSITLKLFPEAVIFGRIESGGDPIENLPMKVMALRIHDGRKAWVRQGGGTTDADGAFRINGLIPGTYYLSAGPHWERDISGAKVFDKGFAEVFYEDADDVTGATPIQVTAGQQVEANFSIKSPTLFHVSGTINVPPGQSANLMLLDWAGEPLQLPTHFMPEKGEFDAAVPSGSYMLQAQSFGPNGPQMSATIPLRVTSDITGLRLVLTPAINIPVNVQRQNVGTSNPNGRGSDTVSGVDVNGINFHVTSSDGSLATVVLRAQGHSVENRDFYSGYRVIGGTPHAEISNVEPGTYSAEIIPGSGEWYVQSAQCGSTDLLREDLVVTAGSQPPPIEIVLRNDAASLEWGITSDGQPVAGTILMIPDGYPARTKIFNTGKGRSTSFGFAPGGYSVLAVDGAQDLEYTNPEVITPYLSRAQHVTLLAGQRSEVNLELIKMEKP